MSEAARWVGAFETHTVTRDMTHGMTHDVTQVSEAARWVEFFETHDKYTRVGGVAAAEPIDLDEVRVTAGMTSYPGVVGTAVVAVATTPRRRVESEISRTATKSTTQIK